MNGKYRVLDGPGRWAPDPDATVHRYYVQAEETLWDYAPSCQDTACSNIAKVSEEVSLSPFSFFLLFFISPPPLYSWVDVSEGGCFNLMFR